MRLLIMSLGCWLFLTGNSAFADFDAPCAQSLGGNQDDKASEARPTLTGVGKGTVTFSLMRDPAGEDAFNRAAEDLGVSLLADISLTLTAGSDDSPEAFAMRTQSLAPLLSRNARKALTVSSLYSNVTLTFKSASGQTLTSFDYENLGLGASGHLLAKYALGFHPREARRPVFYLERIVRLAKTKFMVNTLLKRSNGETLADILTAKFFQPEVKQSLLHPKVSLFYRMRQHIERSASVTPDVSVAKALNLLLKHMDHHAQAFGAGLGTPTRDELRQLAVRTELAVLLSLDEMRAKERFVDFQTSVESLKSLLLRRRVTLAPEDQAVDFRHVHTAYFRDFALAVDRLDLKNDQVTLNNLCHDEIGRLFAVANHEESHPQLRWHEMRDFQDPARRSRWLLSLSDAAAEKFLGQH